jgi:hypothetical protein
MIDERLTRAFLIMLLRLHIDARLTQLVERHVASDVENPRLAAAFRAKAGCMPEQAKEHFLDEVFAHRRTASHLQAIAIHAALMAFEERAEARRIAIRNPSNQLFVGDCLHELVFAAYRLKTDQAAERYMSRLSQHMQVFGLVSEGFSFA